jgi:hypothetical protein
MCRREIQEEEYDGEGQGADRKIDVETKSPCQGPAFSSVVAYEDY